MVEQGKKEEADAQWEEVSVLLDKWKGVEGADEVRRQCEHALTGKPLSSDNSSR